MTFHLAHITDSHLSDGKPYFLANFAAVAADLRSDPPDLIVNTGDVSLNGADLHADLATARRLHDGIGLAWRAIPGNHDVGDNREIAKSQPADSERLARWRTVMGADSWTLDVPGWRLLGLNSLLLGSDLPEEAAQAEMIAEAAAGIGDRRLLLFVHKPLFHDSLADTDVSGHAVNPIPRARLLAALGDVRPTLVCTGHLHEHRERAADGMMQVWAPATSFTLSDWFLPTHGGQHICGYIRIALEADGGFSTRLVQPEGLVEHDLADFPEAYGDLRAIRAAHATGA